eukprot:Gb_00674 [translate_table: standard]
MGLIISRLGEVLHCLCCKEDTPYGLARLKTDFEMGNVIRVGRFGVVRRFLCRKTRKVYACKLMRRSKEAIQEISILKQLAGHPSILKLKDVYEDDEYLYMFTNLCKGGDLQDMIHKRLLPCSEVLVAHIIKSLVEALQYCHSKGVVHLDVKPENIFISFESSSSVAVLGDFGHAHFFQNGNLLHGECESIEYSAPEVLGKIGHSKEADIWSAGVVLYLALCGELPFQGEDRVDLYNRVMTRRLDLHNENWKRVSNQAKDLVHGMLDCDVRTRLTSSQVLSHPWIVAKTQFLS